METQVKEIPHNEHPENKDIFDQNSQTCNLDPPSFYTFHLVENAFDLSKNIFQYEFTVRHISDNGNDTIEQIDEDIAVTRSQMNFICPITQMEMRRPVRNKVCGHIYEEEAILEIIQSRKQKKKKVRCPKMGCSHIDVKGSDLVPDEALKRVIDSQNKQNWSTLDK
ncbi:E3 SUMO-protein ligase NSE2 [Willisornis vidua]|uniref:E3 SUMO-protein ligase NSE2 n=1 Tax=Willisornis vidua TaxID=1566151 RepID=A0ABQ9CPK9_9PASS|nr:E3 SUMO-protein ligase NSE2 [Willisornis vidua]